FCPPAYPETALITPWTCWYTPCTPQKQPPARTMVAEAACAAGSSSSGAGTLFPVAAADRGTSNTGSTSIASSNAVAARAGARLRTALAIGVMDSSHQMAVGGRPGTPQSHCK